MTAIRRRRAVLIGVSQYQFPDCWLPLKGVARDVETLGGVLAKCDFEVIRLTTREETSRTAILSRVRELCFEMPADGSLFIHFAGHGASLARHQWLVPADAPRVPVGGGQQALTANFEDYLLPADFRGAIAETDAARTLFVLDACRTNLPQLGRRDASPFLAAPSRPNQWVVLVHAARPGQEALESPESGGVLTRAIVKALTRGADQPLSDILAFAEEEMSRTLKRHGYDPNGAGLRIQYETGPRSDILKESFFAPLGKAPPTRRQTQIPASLPELDRAAFFRQDERARRGTAHAYLDQLCDRALAFAKERRLPSRLMPSKIDRRVFEDDAGFLDFNFWAPTSPVNMVVPARNCLWFYFSLAIGSFEGRQPPGPEEVEVHFGAVFAYGLRRLARRLAKKNKVRISFRRTADELKQVPVAKSWKVFMNDLGNLEVTIRTFTLAELSADKAKTFFAVVEGGLRELDGALQAAVGRAVRDE